MIRRVRSRLSAQGERRIPSPLLILILVTAILPQQSTAAESPEQNRILAHVDSLRDASQWGTALEFAAPHVAAAQDQGDSTFLLRLIMRQGSIWSGIGEVQRAERALSEALMLAEAQRDTTATCYVLRWLSVAISNQGRSDEARMLNERLLNMARKIGSPVYEGWALVGMAWEAMSAGDNRGAMELYHQAIPPLRRARLPDGLAWAWNGLASAHVSLGAFDEALICYRRAAKKAADIEVTSMRQFVRNNVMNNLAGLEYRFGDPSAAAEYFREAYELQRSAGHTYAAIVPGINVALCLDETGRTTAALAQLDTLATSCQQAGYYDLLGKVLLRRAATYQKVGQLSDAALVMRQALALGDSLTIRDRIAAHAQLAKVLSDADSGAVALELLTEGLRLLEVTPEIDWALKMRTVLGRVLFRAGLYKEALVALHSVVRHEQELDFIRLSMEALTLAAQSYLALDLPDSALTHLEDAAQVWETDRGAPLDPEWREERGAVSREIYTDLAVLLLDAKDGLPPEARIGAAFDRLQVFKARTLMERVRGPGSSTGMPPDDIVSLERLQTEVLRPGELLLDGFLGPRTSLIFGVTREKCRVLRLPSDAVLERKLRLFHGMVATPPSPDSLVDSALLESVRTDLGDQCLGGLNELLQDCRRIVLSPDGLLNLMPLSFLLPKESLDSLQITRVPSATYLAWLRSRGAPAGGDQPVRMLAIAGSQATLPGAVTEVRRLTRNYVHVDALISPEDTLINGWGERFAGYDALHLAAHAEADDKSPWRSMIVLASCGEEYHLHADRIADLQLGARLAVLSSCATASGRILSGEGVQGLCTAFLSAGVPAVLATLWEVEDRTTARFMAQFYVSLSSGAQAAEALRSAQVLLRADPHTRHPYFWAGFVLVGDGDVRLPLEPRRRVLDRKTLLGIVLGTVILSAVLRWMLRSRS